ncbi:MAG: zinc-dependent metalloprotease family protein, partial [Phycisphaerae bacterium]
MLSLSRMGLSLCVVGTMVVLAVDATNAGAGQTGASQVVLADPALVERVNAEFNLADSVVATLDYDTTPGVSQRLMVPADQAVFTLDIAPYSVRSSEHYQVKYQRPDGSFEIVQPGPLRTVRGSVPGIADSIVAGSVGEDGLHLMIVLPDADRWWVEPIAGRVGGAGPHDHVIYRDRDVLGGGGTCATEVLQSRDAAGGQPVSLGGPCNSDVCVTELACDSDVEYFQRWRSGVEQRINFITNTMNVQYESEIGVTHVITTIIVRPREPDPYTSFENHPLLLEFQSHWVTQQGDVVRDVAELFTGRSIIGSVIGEALTLGAICSGTLGYCFVQSDYNNSNQCATDLSAHELGHLWDADHCDCPGNTMNPSITCSNTFHAAETRPEIRVHRDSRLCLSDQAPVTVFPFEDSFTGVSLDPAKWIAGGATISSLARDPPSPPLSLRINENDRAVTGFINTSNVNRVGVEYWWQRTGSAGSPEPGEDLVLDYHGAGGNWTRVDRQLGDPGGGGDDEPFARSCLILPADASHHGLQLRFSINGSDVSSSDNFFVDDFRVVDASEFLNITRQPETTCACQGGTVELSVEVDGEPPFDYRWKHDGQFMFGQTEPTLVFAPVEGGDFGSYSVEVLNGCGTIESEKVELRQSNTPFIIVPPQGTTVDVGGSLFLNYFAVGGGCNRSQWLFNGAPLAGETDQSLIISDVQCSHQGCYSVEVFNDCGSVTSAIAEIIVNGDCGPFSCVDAEAPVILHGEGLAGQTRPFSGYIDPRRESDNGVDLNQGITEV